MATTLQSKGWTCEQRPWFGIAAYGTNDVIQGNFLGTDVTGTQACGNAGGVALFGTDGLVGGTTPTARNLISGNNNIPGIQGDYGAAGVYLSGIGSVVEGNFIGTDVTGTLPLGNGPDGQGVTLHEFGVLVGGTASGAGNLISGNSYGILLIYGTGGIVEGNFIGTDVTGTKAVGNYIGINNNSGGSAPSMIGGTEDGQAISQGKCPVAREGNLISGNDSGVYNNNGVAFQVEGNYIGADVTGTVALGNRIGIEATNAAVGQPGAGNLISGNSSAGVYLDGDSSQVQGNLIGTDWTGTKALGNGFNPSGNGYGVGIFGGNDNTIGGTTAGARNVISGNEVGVGMGLPPGSYYVPSTGNLVEGDYIGTDIGGTERGPKRHWRKSGSRLGQHDRRDDRAARNIISGFMGGYGAGVEIGGLYDDSPGPSANLVEGNYIGTDVSGTVPLGSSFGIVLKAP